jgi:hypothetical protein
MHHVHESPATLPTLQETSAVEQKEQEDVVTQAHHDVDRPEFTITGIFDQVREMNRDAEIVIEQPGSNGQSVSDDGRRDSNQSVSESDLNKANSSAPSTALPAWLLWILHYICCIATTTNVVGVAEANGDVTVEQTLEAEHAKQQDPIPCPFCCCPRSIMCTSITDDHTPSCCFRQPVPNEDEEIRVYLLCCSKLVLLPQWLRCCVVATRSGRVHLENDVVTKSIKVHPESDVTTGSVKVHTESDVITRSSRSYPENDVTTSRTVMQ